MTARTPIRPPNEGEPATGQRLVVELIPNARHAVDRIVEGEQINKTTAVNRALLVLDFIRRFEADGGQVLLLQPDGTTERMVLL